MNWIERKFARLAWARMEGRMPKALKRYLPLAGTAIVAGSVVAKLLGFEAVGQALDTVGSLTGLSGQTILDGAAIASVAGVCLKLWSEAKKLGGKGGDFVKPR